jgi:hypothetical protein
MSLDFRAAMRADSVSHAAAEAQSDRRERIVTVLAASLAVLTVAAIAVLMGMA